MEQSYQRSKIESFTNLDTWKKSYELVLMIYSLTKNFPKDELFGLVSQMRRCGVSVKDKMHFYNISRGSLIELHNQILIAQGIGYITSTDEYIKQLTTVHKLLNGLIAQSKLRLQKQRDVGNQRP